MRHESERKPIAEAQPGQILVDARHVVTNPQIYSERPLLRRLAWAALKAERRQRIIQRHIADRPSSLR